VIDAAGQHAGTLKVAASSGSTASLAISSGWIDVAHDVFVGPAGGGSGAIMQSGGILHASSVTIGSTSTYTITGGTLSTPLLARSGGGTFNLLGGTLHAERVAFSLVNQGGTIAPGSDAALQLIAMASFPDENGIVSSPQCRIGTTTVNGDLTLQAGTLQIELASLTSFDSIAVDGALSLDGALDVQLLNGYSPSPRDQWLIGTASSITGTFASIPSGYAIQTTGGNLILTAVPEPTLALALPLLVLTLRRSRRSHLHPHPLQ
jgi:hypothetical protein